MNQKKAILIHTVHKFHSQREVWQCRHVFLTGYPEMSSGILKGERPRVCPAPDHCTTALAQMLTVAEVGRALGGSAGGNGTAVGKVERSKTGPEAVHAPPRVRRPSGRAQRATEGAERKHWGRRRRARPTGGSVSDARCPATRTGLLELRRKLESSRRPLSQSPRRSSPERPAASPG